MFQPWVLQIQSSNIFDVDFSVYVSLSNSLSKIIFLTNALIVPIFLFFLIKLVPFGSSNIVIHVSSNEHFCAGFFSWTAIIVNEDFKMQIFICGLFPELIELSCHHGWFHFSARPVYKYWVFLTSLYTSKRLFFIFINAASNLQFWTPFLGQL